MLSSLRASSSPRFGQHGEVHQLRDEAVCLRRTVSQLLGKDFSKRAHRAFADQLGSAGRVLAALAPGVDHVGEAHEDGLATDPGQLADLEHLHGAKANLARVGDDPVGDDTGGAAQGVGPVVLGLVGRLDLLRDRRQEAVDELQGAVLEVSEVGVKVRPGGTGIRQESLNRDGLIARGDREIQQGLENALARGRRARRIGLSGALRHRGPRVAGS
jgi:hypothetical protein